jgi:hypothetical protein
MVFCIKRMIALCQVFMLDFNFPRLGIGVGPNWSYGGVALKQSIAVVSGSRLSAAAVEHMTGKCILCSACYPTALTDVCGINSGE